MSKNRDLGNYGNAALLDADSTATANTVVKRTGDGSINVTNVTASGTITGTVSGTADALTTARTIALSGDVSGSASFDGSANVTITATVADDSHNHIIGNVDGLQDALDAKVDTVVGKGLSTEDYTTAEKNKLAGIEAGAEVNTVTSVATKTGAVTLDKSDVGLANVDNTSDLNKPISTATQTALNLKAPLASPALSGTPTAPTAVAGTNTTQIATTAFVQGAVSGLVDAAPATLDTLNELAAALGDDPNFATTVSTQIGTKLDASAYTAADVLTKIKTVDGAASGLDADLLDGQHASAFAAASHTHAISDVTGLQGALDGKAPLTGAGTSGTWGISITGSSRQLSLPSNQTEYTILSGPANGPVIKVRYDSSTVNRYIDIGTIDGNGVYYEGLKIFNGGTPTWQGSGILHAGNYNSYSPTLTGGGASGTWGINITGSATSLNLGGHSISSSAWAGGGGYHGYTYNGGNFRFGFSSTSGVVDVYADGNFYATDSSHLVLHAGNYNSYSPTLTGGGASGTWGISVTGNAATVTNGVYTTGDQTIGGSKTFSSGIFVGGNSTGADTTSGFAGSTQYVIEVVHNRNNTTGTYNDAVTLTNKTNVANNYTQIGLRSTDADGEHHRATILAHRDVSGTASGVLKLRTRPASGNPTDTLTLFSNGDAKVERGSFFAPIFYDSNNTGYYVNPNSNSYVSGEFQVQQSGTSGFRLISPTGTQSLWVRAGYSGAPTATSSPTNIQFQSSGSSAGTFNYWCGNTLALSILGDYAVGEGSLRAPIFYDSNNTAYYTDPSSTSNLVALTMSGNITFNNSGTGKRGITGTMGDNDQWFVGGAATASNAGYLEISTGDDGQTTGAAEYIYVRQYGPGNPLTGSLVRTGALLDNNGNTWFPGNVTAFYSDERLKNKTGTIDNAVNKVKSLEGFYYVENDLARAFGYNNSEQQVGLSAQKVQNILPEAVSLAPFDRVADELTNDSVSKSGENYLTVDYARLVPLLVEAIKEQQTHIERLESIINKAIEEGKL